MLGETKIIIEQHCVFAVYIGGQEWQEIGTAMERRRM